MKLHVVEFFSGIGGWRCAIQQALSDHNSKFACDSGEDVVDVSLASCHAYDISLEANAVYRHNFLEDDDSPSFSIRTKLVEQLKAEDLPHECNMWTLSPPCQPFTKTRHAKRRDSGDNRCDGLHSLLDLLLNLVGDDDSPNTNKSERPFWILLENVKGFVGSQMHFILKERLLQCGYSWKEVLMSPTHVGIPNHRMRYYILCERSDRFFVRRDAKVDQSSLVDFLPEIGPLPLARPLSEFLWPENHLDGTTLDELAVPNSLLTEDWAKDIPIVSSHDRHSRCFTAFYARQIHRATGSILLMDGDGDGDGDGIVNESHHSPIDRTDMTKHAGRLRRFAPEELLLLFGFPKETFSFPPEMKMSHKFKLVGNSISVFVAKELAKELVFFGDHKPVAENPQKRDG